MPDSHAVHPMQPLIELCVASVTAAEIAARCGVGRIELNAAYELGGLTPSLGTLIEVRSRTSIPIISMLRPSPGGFCYDDAGIQVMQRDAELLLRAGADGLALGYLKEDHTVDFLRCRDLIRQAGDKPVVFHRAFDETPDPFVAMEQLIDLGFRRILTSGQQPNALAGADLLASLIEKAAGRIEILPGGGVRAEHVSELIARTGCTQVHTSLRGVSPPGQPTERCIVEFLESVRGGRPGSA